jgi:hypothetical protein
MTMLAERVSENADRGANEFNCIPNLLLIFTLIAIMRLKIK